MVKAVLLGKLKGAQCSEPVNSRVPSIWFVRKIWDFLVAQEQKFGARGHRALLEPSPDGIWHISKLDLGQLSHSLQWLWTSIDLEVGLYKSQTKCMLF